MSDRCESTGEKPEVENIESVVIDEATNRRLLRKIDRKLMPVVSARLGANTRVLLKTVSYASPTRFNTTTRPL
jgi:hypothetical protein